jgi:uncharacterized repeat protein (TIGR03803 family)
VLVEFTLVTLSKEVMERLLAERAGMVAPVNRLATPILVGLILIGFMTGCGGGAGTPSMPPLGASQAAPQQEKTFASASASLSASAMVSSNDVSSSSPFSSFTPIYNFTSAGGNPNGGLSAVNGALYGTTIGSAGTNPSGTVFELSTSGTERVVLSNISGVNGGLTAVNGTLYGTTSEFTPNTGANGTVFGVSMSGGTARELYSYRGGSPNGGLLEMNGTLYGTATDEPPIGTYSSANPWGAVFEVSTSGTRGGTLYSFKGGTDGNDPVAGLIEVNGALYGTTFEGGANNLGTVFMVSTSGTERVLYSFKGGMDGQYPNGGLTIAANGALYGTTYEGGGADNVGTIFEVSTSGTERVVYRFKWGTDGDFPNGGLTIAANGDLYGTTYQGGENNLGTIFEVNTSGTERVLHSFGTDGGGPQSSLIEVNGALYGTTRSGTVFKVSP